MGARKWLGLASIGLVAALATSGCGMGPFGNDAAAGSGDGASVVDLPPEDDVQEQTLPANDPPADAERLEDLLADGADEVIAAGTYGVTLEDPDGAYDIYFTLDRPARTTIRTDQDGLPAVVRLWTNTDEPMGGTTEAAVYIGPVGLAWDNESSAWSDATGDPEAWLADFVRRGMVVLRTETSGALGEHRRYRVAHELAPGAYFEKDGERYEFVTLLNFFGDPDAGDEVFQWRASPPQEAMTIVQVGDDWVGVVEEGDVDGRPVDLVAIVRP